MTLCDKTSCTNAAVVLICKSKELVDRAASAPVGAVDLLLCRQHAELWERMFGPYVWVFLFEMPAFADPCATWT